MGTKNACIANACPIPAANSIKPLPNALNYVVFVYLF
jgi:hypothetical protein